MDETIICPSCGETNPVDMPYCHNCQWRLRALDEDWPAERTPDQTPGTPPSSDDGATVPDWLRSAPTQPRPELAAEEAAADLLRQRLTSSGGEDAPLGESQRDESEDLLAGLTHAEQPDEEPLPDWVARIMGITDGEESDQAFAVEAGAQAAPDQHSDFIDPLLTRGAALSDDDGHKFDPDSTPTPTGAPPEGIDTDSNAEIGGRRRERDDVFEWLRQLDANNAAPPMRTAGKDVPATTDVPTWVGRMLGVTGEAAPDEKSSDPSLPNWLQGVPSPGVEFARSPARSDAEDLAAPQLSEQAPVEPPLEPPTAPVPDTSVSASATGFSATDDGDALDVDAIFASMQMPTWAGSSGPTEMPEASARPPAARDDPSIEPADLPSWVQAMRPVESAVAAGRIQQTVSPHEADGPLRGLAGVLPAIPGAAVPSSRPKSHAMKLDISERHQMHARLLDEILEAEGRALPLKAAESASSPRLVRWLISAVLLSLLMLGLVSGSSNFALPAGVPFESDAAMRVVQNLAPDSAVLAVFDYEPATAGEMEVAAASILDNLLLLKHPRLALLSTSPTGSALAERFVFTTLHERAYARGQQYVDLGYLPGGLSGVQFFAQDPVTAAPYGAAADRAWDTEILRGTRMLTDFGAIIVLTDSLESGRVWIEQTTGLRGAVPMLIVASAQAGPMLLPYFDAGQIQGLVIGINGAASTEVANGGRPGLVRRYWDAYSLGLYSAAILVTLGALWQVAGGLRRRRTGDA